MTDDIVARLRAGSYLYNEETRNTEHIITKNERLAADEIARLRGEVERLTRERDETFSAIGTDRYLDPPDGGDVPLAEQVRRMKADCDAAIARAEAAERERDSVKEELANVYANDLNALERAEAAEAKVAKLREALKPVAAFNDEESPRVYEHEGVRMVLVHYDVIRRVSERARTALQETNDGE